MCIYIYIIFTCTLYMNNQKEREDVKLKSKYVRVCTANLYELH